MKLLKYILYIILIEYLLMIDISTAPNTRQNEISKRGAYAYSTNIEIRCFSNDSIVQLTNGEYKHISLIKPGDKLLTIEKSFIKSTEMIMMLHKSKLEKALFYTFRTKSGHQISLTENHLVPIKSHFNNNEKYIPAKEIQKGDLLFILLNNRTIKYSPIICKTIEIKQAYYAPLTIKGTLLINNILSSCFANVKNHNLAQISMFPLRFYYTFLKLFHLKYLFNNENEDINWFIKLIFYSARYFFPQTLIL
ncbi:unnamed protein product [Adineta steineri]|uniref:Hint domain-containing protein n=2 Tax=Adineta steineri TaxID=433720 RepID=A0A818FS18_9BILA|nr:unnamed protein product [Adineta steineri]